MSLAVQKFGGTSVADAARIKNVADIITERYDAGDKVVAIVSAQGDTTDELIEKAKEINPNASKREMDVLLSVGEQISIALLAMEIEKRGYPVISLTGWQIGLRTDDEYSSAHIKRVDALRLRNEIDKGNIVIVAGFQGVNSNNDITTLGRGGSDTTAVAVAAVLNADICQIFTDVDGVYSADPRIIKDACKMDKICYDEMLELASLGAQVLHNRSVELAKRYQVNLEVLSSFSKKPGTIVTEVDNVEKANISGVAKDNNIAAVMVKGLNDASGDVFRLFSNLAKYNISIDMITKTIGVNNLANVGFTIKDEDAEKLREDLEEIRKSVKFEDYIIEKDVCKVSAVGAGMVNRRGVAAAMFEAIYNADIKIYAIATSEITISVIVRREDGERAMKAVHERFFG